MPPAYTSTQKAAISQFVSFTSLDRTSAARILKSHNWDVQNAINGHFQNNSTAHPPSSATKTNLNKLFDKYRDDPRSNPDSIGLDGASNYFHDIGVDLEDVGLFIVSEIVQSPSMGELTREGFVNGWSSLGADTTASQKSLIATRRSQLSAPEHRDLLRRIYRHTFTLALAPPARSIDLDAALVYWRLLFSAPSLQWSTPSTPWLDWWCEFLETRFKKAVNKDLWDQTFKLVEECIRDESMSWWDENGAWPGVIDEFVAWVGEKRGGERMEE